MSDLIEICAQEPGCCNTNILSFSANTDINNGWNENKKFRVDAKKTKDNSRKDNKSKIKNY